MTAVLAAVVVVALAAVACASVLARTREHAVAALLLWSFAGALLAGAALART